MKTLRPLSAWASLRAAVLFGCGLGGLMAQSLNFWLWGSLAMFAEVVWWYPRFTFRYMQWPREKTDGRLVVTCMIAAGLLAYLVMPLRVLAGLGLFWWVMLGRPVVHTHRASFQEWRANRTLSKIQKATGRTSVPSLAIAGHARSARLKLRQLTGGEPEPVIAPAPPAPPAAPAPVEELEEEYAIEFASARGVLRTDAAGRQFFEPMEITR